MFARCVSRFAALHAGLHELAVLAAGRILVAAHRALILAQLAVLVAALIVVLGSQQTGVALLVAFDPQIPAEGFLRLGEAATALRLQNFSNRAQRTRRELLVVDVVAADRISVHEEAPALRCRW